MRWLRRILVLAVVLFAGFYLVTRPVEAAGAVRGLFTAVGAAFNSIVRFFTALAS